MGRLPPVRAILFLVGFLFAFSRCGGGGTAPAPLTGATPPTVSSIQAENGGTSVTPTGGIAAIFSKPVNPSTVNSGTFTVSDSGGNPVPGNVTCSGSIAVFRPIAPFALGADYTVALTIGIQDTSGNPLASRTTWDFRTVSESSPDTTPPAPASVYPPPGTPWVPDNASLIVAFSEAVDPATVTADTFLLTDAQERPVAGTVSCTGTVATFRPSAPLTLNRAYRATLRREIADLAGNSLPQDYAWTFWTGPVSAPDNTAPFVVEISPPGGSSGAYPGTVLRATFSEPMDPATIDADSFTLTDDSGNPVPGTVTYSGYSAFLAPAVPLLPGTGYTAALSTAITDGYGNPTAARYTWHFFVNDELPDALQLVGPNEYWGGCSAGYGDGGDVFVAWISEYGVRARRRPAGGDWEEPVLIAPNSAGNYTIPRVVVDSAGNALVAWDEGGLGYNRYVVGKGWGTATQFGGSNAGLQLAGNASGHAVAVWGELYAYRAWARTFSPDTGWSAPILLSESPQVNSDSAQVSMDPAGNAVAVWAETSTLLRTPRYHVYARRFAAGAGWEPPVLLDDSTGLHARMPQVGMDDRGNAVAVWSQYRFFNGVDGLGYDALYAARYSPGEGWSASEYLRANDVLWWARYPGLAVSPAGNAMAVGTIWGDVRTFSYDRSSGWSPGLIPTSGGGVQENPHPISVIMDENDRAVAAWSQSDGTRQHLWTSRYTPGSGWETPAMAETDNTASVFRFHLAMNRHGQACLNWLQSDGIWIRLLR